MKKQRIQEKIALKIASVAKKQTYQTVGKSIPWGMYEVEVSQELRQLVEKNEDNKHIYR